MKISHRAISIQESPIRKLAPLAAAARARGVKIYNLNIGQPDVATPPEFLRAVCGFKDKVLEYGPSDGLPGAARGDGRPTSPATRSRSTRARS